MSPMKSIGRLIVCAIALMAFSTTGWAQTKIVPIGNSITQADASHDSYRRSLWHLLQSGGHNVDFVGSLSSNNGGPAPNPDFDLDHEGHWGQRADEILNGLPNWLSGYTPDIALVHVGSNDVFQGQSVASTVDDIEGIIDALRDDANGGNPNVVILLAKLIPAVSNNMSSINAEIDGIASRKHTAQSPVVVVDQNTGFDPETDTYDDVHPNLGGEEKMANVWYNAVTPFLGSGPVPLSHYRLEETSGATTAADAQGNHSGSYLGTPTLGVNGLAFGSSRAIDLGGSSGIDIGTFDPGAEMTLMTWVDWDGPGSYQNLFAKRAAGGAGEPGGTEFRFMYFVDIGGTRLRFWDDTGTMDLGYDLSTGTPTHLALVLESGATKLYANGNLVTTGRAPNLGAGTGAPFAIGIIKGLGNGFDGTMDEVRIFASALTADEVANVYSGEVNFPPDVALGTMPTGVVQGDPLTIPFTATDIDGTVASLSAVLDPSGLDLEGTINDLGGGNYEAVWSSAPTAGTYTVEVTATDNEGSSRSASGSVTTHAPVTGWDSRDIGPVPSPGSFSESNDVFTITASGTGIGGTSDQFHYGYQILSGDGSIVAQITSLERATDLTRGGVMIRETLSSDSKHAFMGYAPNRVRYFQHRATTGAGDNVVNGGKIAPPQYLRIERSGSTFTGSTSSDGISWTEIGSADITMASDVFVGLAVTAGSDGASITSTFENVTLNGAAPVTPNAAPTASFTATPTSGSSPLLVNFDGTGSTDSDGSIVSYAWDFGDGSSGTGSTTSHTYAPGTFTATLTVTDDDGDSHSTSTTITVTDPSAALAHYLLDETSGTSAADEQGNHPGTYFNDPTLGVAGIAPGSSAAVSFGGANGVNIGTFDPGAEMTLMAWVNWGGTGSYQNLFAKRAAGSTGEPGQSNFRFMYFVENASSQLKFWDDDGIVDLGYSMASGQVTHLALVLESGAIKLYVDGALQTTGRAPSLGAGASAPFAFGMISGGAFGFEGVMDDVKIFGAALTESQIAAESGVTLNEPPTVALGTIPSGVLEGSQLTIPFTATDSDGTVASAVAVLDPAGLAQAGTVNDLGGGNYEAVWASAPAAGTYTVEVTATDDDGAQGSASGSVTTHAPVTGWNSQDIGPVAAPGSFSESNDVFTVTASGTGIDGTSDEFHYVYQMLSGDGSMVAQITSLERATDFTKGGVMIRETLSSDSKHAFMGYAPNRVRYFQHRATTGAGDNVVNGGKIAPPQYLRIERSGSTFTGSTSSDGISWTEIGSADITMASDVFVGLAVTAGSDGASITSTFENVTLNGAAPVTPNAAPTASFTATPTSGSSPLLVNFDGTGSTDSDGSIVSYAWDFGDGSSGTGSTTSHTYAPGTFTATLTVTDDDGDSHSTSTTITVTDPSAALAHYLLDETSGTSAADEQGNHPGTYFNDPTLGVAGIAPGSSAAVSFGGANGVNIGTFDPGAEMTLMAWVNWGGTGSYQNLFAKRAAGSTGEPGQSNFRFMYFVENASSQLKFWDDDGIVDLGYSMASGQVTHLALVLESGAIKLYVDGALQTTGRAPSLGAGASAPFAFGMISGGAFGFEGVMDDVKIFGTALMAGQVADEYAGTVNEAPTVVLGTIPSGVVEGTQLTIPFTASDADGTVTSTAAVLDPTGLAQAGTVNDLGSGDYEAVWASAPAAGTYTVEVTATDDDGAPGSASGSVEIEVDPNSAPTVALGTIPTDVVEGDPLTIPFTATDSDGTVASTTAVLDPTGLAEAGTVNDLGGGSYEAVWASAPAAGTYTVEVTATDDDGASGSASGSVTTNAAVSPVVDWTPQDIGAVTAAGSFTESSGTFSIDASGEGIGGTMDEFFFIYRTLSGDGSLVAQITGLTKVNDLTKGGVMIRESLTSDSRHAYMAYTPRRVRHFQYRSVTGSSDNAVNGGKIAPPQYLRIERSGNTFTGSTSSDGSSWEVIGSAEITMATDVYVGLAVTSSSDGAFTTATFENVTLTSDGSIGKGGPSIDADAEAVPESFALMGNYPNPFNPQTRIQFATPEQTHVTLEVFDVLGRPVRMLLDRVQPAGTHEVYFDAGSLPSGVYIYRLSAGSFEQVGTMMLLK